MQNGYNVDATDSQIKRADNYTNLQSIMLQPHILRSIRIPIFEACQI